MNLIRNRRVRLLGFTALVGLFLAATACGSDKVTETIVQTVIVEQVVTEQVAQTVIVEKEVVVAGETIIQTVIVEKAVEVIVEKAVEVAGETIIQTVIVEQPAEVVVVTATPLPVTEGPPAPVVQSGTLIVAVQLVGTPSGLIRDCPWCATLPAVGVQETMFSNFRDDAGAVALAPQLVESWTTSTGDDGAFFTDFKLREGIPFHRGFGELTAEDVAYTYNEANPATQPLSVHDTGGALPPVLNEVLPQSKYVVRFPWVAFNAVTFTTTLSDFSEGYGIFSKSAAVSNGDDWARKNMIGTGPFVLQDWTQGLAIEVQAVRDHWRKTPSIQTVKWLEIPEGSTRRAMLETGEAQIAEVEVKDFPALAADGFVLAGVTGALLATSYSGENQKFRAMSFSLAQGFIMTETIVHSIKLATDRHRPNGENKRSIPSGHTSSLFTYATVISHYYGSKAGIPAYAVATLYGLSRIEKRKHHLSDVVAGAALGYLIGRTVVKVTDRRATSKQMTLTPVIGQETMGVSLRWTW